MTDAHVNPETMENFHDAMATEASAARRLAMIRDLQERGLNVSADAIAFAEDYLTSCRKATDATFQRLSVSDQVEISARFVSLTVENLPGR